MWGIKRWHYAAACLVLAAAVTVAAAGTPDAAEPVREDSAAEICAYEVAGNRHTQFRPAGTVPNHLSLDGFEKKLENELLSVWYGKEDETLRVVDKRTGYVWGCISGQEGGLNKKWAARASSLCYITYFDVKDKENGVALSDRSFSTSYQWKADSAVCSVTAKKLGFSFRFEIKLDGGSMQLSLDDKSLKETGKNRLSSVSFLSFFGSSYEDTVPGYVMIPDGSGALIRFAKTKAYASGYNKRFYGKDLAVDSMQEINNMNGNRTDDYATDESTPSLPCWGMVHGEGQNAFLATVDSGEDYAVLSAIPAGAESETVRYTRAYATFYYRSLYNKKISGTKTVQTPQEEKNQINPRLTFTFLNGEDADYSGMARTYRQKLLAEKKLAEASPRHDKMPILMNIVAAEVKKGFLSNKVTVLTDGEQMNGILQSLEQGGISAPTVVLSGWQKGGYSGARLHTVKTEKKAVSQKQLTAWRERVTQNGGSFVLSLNAVTGNEDQLKIKRHVALNGAANPIKTGVPNKTLLYPDTYYLRPALTDSYLNKVAKAFSDFDLLAEGFGKYLYSDYTVDREQTRTEVKNNAVKTADALKQKLYLDGANLYLMHAAAGIFNIPVNGSQYIYETDSVPFLQMVLRGSTDCYAPYANRGFYSRDSVLKMIEYGCYPSFMVMGEDNFALNDTPLEQYFSLSYSDWESKIFTVYAEVEQALRTVEGASLVSHRTVAEGVYCVTYDNGVSIWLNYTQNPYPLSDGTAVGPAGYAVKEAAA